MVEFVGVLFRRHPGSEGPLVRSNHNEEFHAHRRAEGNQESRIPRGHDAAGGARADRARPRGVRGDATPATASACDDEMYTRVGAQILPNADEVFASADMIVKVKEPQPVEIKRLRPGQMLFTYLHLAPDPEQTKGLLEAAPSASPMKR